MAKAFQLIGLGLTMGAVAMGPVRGQEETVTVAREVKVFEVPRATSEIEIDGELDEPAWQEAAVIPLIYEYFPGNNIPPPVETEGLVTYDDSRLYIAFRAFDPEPRRVRAHLMARDEINTFVQDDHVTIMLDTFNDERRAFQFRINPLGVQADAIFSEVDGIEDWSWDMIWASAGRVTNDGYVVEVSFPFEQLRFQKTQEVQTWGIELGRSYPRSSRHRITDSVRDRDRSCIICQFNKISGLEGLEPGRNLELDPTVTAVRTDELDEFPEGDLVEADQEADAGLTIRWGITPNTALLGTINPDFSQVEADVAQLNVNERFALFFEEKRPFFLEGVDFFSTPINAVHTRTVHDPDWGIKLTGKEKRNALGVFVADDSVNGFLIPSNQGTEEVLLEEAVTNTVFRYRRDVGSTSTLGVLYTGREGDDYHNRVAGLDGFLRVTEKDTIEFQYMRSDTLYPEEVAVDFEQELGSFSDYAFQIEYSHDQTNWYWEVEYKDHAPGFRLDSGFVPRVDFRELEGILFHRFWGEEESWYDRWDIGAFAERVEDYQGQLTDEELGIFGRFWGPLQTQTELSIMEEKEYFDGVLYENLLNTELYVETQPSGAFKLTFVGRSGDSIDFSNNQPADGLLLNPSIEAKLGRHVIVNLDHTLQKLDVEGGELFEANLSQLRLVYNFNVRIFVRAIVQNLDVTRNPDLYSFEVEPETRQLFTQFLFSYQVNPRTVLFAGYSDNQLGLQDVSLTRTDRTFFFKIGYAWIL
ncbi:MAG: DUF5916 domain-containing protein [Thermoanaerobaculia bacterium]